MKTTINTVNQEVAQYQSPAIDVQTIGSLAKLWAKISNDTHNGNLSPERLLLSEIEKIKFYFEDVEKLHSVELEYLNRAVSFYLLHNPNDIHIKEMVIKSMNSTMCMAVAFEKHATDVAFWSSMFEGFAGALDKSAPEYNDE